MGQSTNIQSRKIKHCFYGTFRGTNVNMCRTEEYIDSRNMKIQVSADHVTGAGDVPRLLT